MDESHRKQVTLFIPRRLRSYVETIRERYNPAQHKLIAAHVTLCRDDEVANWSAVQACTRQLKPVEVSLEFGAPQRDGDFVYLPATSDTASFDALRRTILDDPNCRIQKPHITLIHPRNGTCTDAIYDEICESIGRLKITFDTITFIGKVGRLPWSCECSFQIPS